MQSRSPFPAWWWLFPTLGAVRIVAWLLLAGWEAAPHAPMTSIILVAVFGASGWLLISVGRPQPTPVRLGAIFLLTGGALADDGAFLSAGGIPLLTLASLRPSYFLPAFFWSLATDFPRLRRRDRDRYAPSWLAPVVFALCTIPFLGTFLARRREWTSAAPSFSAGLTDQVGWVIVYVFSLAALGHIAWTSRHASRDERRRVRLFLGGVIAGSTPALVGSLALIASPRLLDFVRSDPRFEDAFLLAAYAGLALVPLVTFYAVLDHNALGLRGAARSTIRALLARQTGWILVASPLAAGLILLLAYPDSRAPPVGSFSTLALAACFALGTATLTRRTWILSFVNRHFFPDQHEIDEAINVLLGGLPSRRSLAELAGVIITAVEETLGLRSGHLLIFDPDRQELRAARGELPPLIVSVELRLQLEREGLVPLRSGDSGSEASGEWSGDTGVEYLVALRGGRRAGADRGHLLGVLAAEGPRSGLPLNPDEARRLVRIAAGVGEAVQRLGDTRPGGGGPMGEEPDLAGLCPRCGAVAPLTERWCAPCGMPLSALELPFILSGRYRLEASLGAGGLGVVYRARDLALDRPVALKTLPTAGSHRVSELRREARFMGRLAHPALATIHGLEIWAGVPVLVLEYFAAGTLHDRILHGALPWRDALLIGVHLAEGLRYLHSKGAIHGDVKPRNIGISVEATMKIMDFGISRLVGEASEPSLAPVEALPTTASSVGRLRGTTLYLPPEILDERCEAGPPVDLWALSVTLHEAISGHHPFRAGTLGGSVARILLADTPDLRSTAPECPAHVAAFFKRALSRTPTDRPATAEEWIAAVDPLTTW